MRKQGINFFPCPQGCGFMRKIGPYMPVKLDEDKKDTWQTIVIWIFWQCKRCLSSAHTDARTGEIIDVVTYDPLAHFGKCCL